MRSTRRILVSQPYGLGDALFITPVLRGLRTLASVEEVDLLLGSRTAPVFRNNPHVDQILTIDKGKWHEEGRNRVFKDLFRLWQEGRKRYDLLLDFSLQREYGFYGQFLWGIPRRIGLNFNGRASFLTDSVSLGNGFDGKHVVDFYCELAKLIGLEIEDRFLEFYLTPADRQEALHFLKNKPLSLSSRFIALAPGGGESWGKDAVFKRWPVSRFIEALALLKERMKFEGVIVLGSAGERGLGEEIERESGWPVVNLAGELSLGASAAILEKAPLFLANDGGLVHLARALHTPLIAFYGPADPVVYGPYPASPEAIALAREELPCRPCYSRFRYNSACVDRECLSALSAQEVFEFLDRKNYWEHFK